MNGVVYPMPLNGCMEESPMGSPLSRGLSSPLGSPPRQLEPEKHLPSEKQYHTPTMSPISTRRTETIIDYEQKKHGPPVVRTTVEGKLKMEKIVGADLITVDSCVSGAWTVRDTVTNYKIKTTIGKKSLILEEIKDGHSKFKITLIENGETKMEREATLEIPEFMNKKDYLTEVGQRLLKDLREDADAVSAVTHVEVEIIEDVTNILKTYVVGERADDYLEEQMIDTIHYEEHVDRTPSPIEQMKVEKIYVDTLTVEDTSHELGKAEINLLKEGRHYEGEGALKRTRRLESDESDETISKTRCANVAADCCLAKREDSSAFTVYIAIPLTQTISMILTRRRAQKREQFSKSFATTQSGQQFEEESSLRQFSQVETIADEREKLVQRIARVQEVLVQRSEKETEADGRKYEMELQGQKLVGDIVIKRRERAVDSESSEELPLTKTMIIKEREAHGGQYAMEMHGVTLRGEKTFHREDRVYESESEESIQWNGGSPTTVDLIKKESHSFFDVVFEISNIYEPQAISIKRAVVKRESCEVNSAFSVERNLAAIAKVKVECSLREAMEEQVMMIHNFENTVPTIAEALVLRREKNRHGASFFTAAAEFEYITLNSLLSHSGEMLEFESSLKTPNIIRNVVKLKEMSLEHATSVIYLHKTPSIQDQYVDTVARDKHVRSDLLRTRAASDSCLIAQYALKRQSSFPSDMVVQANIKTANTSSSSFRSWASENRIINTALMLSKGAATQTAAIKISDRNRQETTTHVAEYGHAQQHCAVMLKNTGGAHGSTSAALAEAVTGGFLIDVDTRTTNKSFHLTNYKTMLPPYGEIQIAWPQATLISASFHLSKLSEHQKLHDENFHQDMRIRRKDAAADVTVYFLYKRVLGNFAMAALGIYVGERIRQIREQHFSKEVVDTSERLERYTRQVECSDEFARIAQTTTVEDDTTGKHLLHEMQLTALMCLSSTVLMYSKAKLVQRSLLNLHACRICPPL
uniref:ANK_REP_REGION domain-containing protein n=1 Tax=Angiostrongylus cantonensis TaxID=6313 RepID=A0A0K0CY16_ANGCA